LEVSLRYILDEELKSVLELPVNFAGTFECLKLSLIELLHEFEQVRIHAVASSKHEHSVLLRGIVGKLLEKIARQR